MMATLPKDKFLEYLKHAIELESSIYAQQQIRAQYDASSEKRKPVLCLESEPEKPVPEINQSAMGAVVPLIWGIMFTVAALVGIMLCTTDWEYNSGVALIFALIFGVPAILCFYWASSIKRKVQAENEARELRYIKNRETYEQKMRAVLEENGVREHRYHNDKQEWDSSNQEIYEVMDVNLSATQEALAALYEHDVIFPKYRNLPALTSIYEYFLTGRCEELSGPHGAYNLYEDEVRKNTVISQLNTIIENLEQIRQNQYMLYEQVKGIRQATQAIAIEMYQIKGYTAQLTELTALNTYYNGINAMNSTALAFHRSL